MQLLTPTVLTPSGWLLDRASGPRSLLWSLSVVGAFSVVTAVSVLRTAQLPEPEPGLESFSQIGVALGFLVAVGGGFLFWLYVAVGTYLALKVVSRSPTLAKLTRLVGVSLIFPLIGRVVSLALQGLPFEWLPTAAYALSVVWGVAMLSRAVADDTGARWLSAIVAGLVPVALTQIPGLMSRLL